MFAEVACERVTGENEAIVGGFGSLACDEASASFPEIEEFDIKSSQGMSWRQKSVVVVLREHGHIQKPPSITATTSWRQEDAIVM